MRVTVKAMQGGSSWASRYTEAIQGNPLNNMSLQRLITFRLLVLHALINLPIRSSALQINVVEAHTLSYN